MIFIRKDNFFEKWGITSPKSLQEVYADGWAPSTRSVDLSNALKVWLKFMTFLIFHSMFLTYILNLPLEKIEWIYNQWEFFINSPHLCVLQFQIFWISKIWVFSSIDWKHFFGGCEEVERNWAKKNLADFFNGNL